MSAEVGAPVTPERIYQFAFAYAPPLVLEAAIRHHVFDVLDSGPKSLEEIHEATGASRRGLSAILNFLVGFDFLRKAGERYTLAPESAAFLVSTKPGFQGGLIRHTSEQLLPKWLHLNEIVATGRPAAAVNQQGPGSEFFQEFVNDIFPMSYNVAQELASHLAFSGPTSVLDLAAGSGVWGIALAQSSPEVRVTAVDWHGVIPVTRATVARFGLSERFIFREGDLLEADFGSNHNVATLGHILHSEGEERSKALLRKTFGALTSGGTIAIAEFLVNAERTGPLNGLTFAINMLVNTDCGNTFSFEEICRWLDAAGFKDARTLDTHGPSPLILATKP
ncbi:MAG TPA: methyltransferase [Terracidiphilus sp.]|jgi:ubiquinone/menaquinone biosynthesis C-methylase UbiE